jgi:hypothetical protein
MLISATRNTSPAATEIGDQAGLAAEGTAESEAGATGSGTAVGSTRTTVDVGRGALPTLN